MATTGGAASVTVAAGTKVTPVDSVLANLFADAAALADGVANPTIGKIAALLMAYNGTTWDRVQLDAAKRLLANIGSPAAATLADGVANPTTVLLASMSMGWNGATWDRLKSNAAAELTVRQAARAAGDLTVYSLNSAATTNANNIKGSAGSPYWISAMNTNAAARYLRLYNKATAPVPASDNALIIARFIIPGNAAGAGLTINLGALGLSGFTNGIGLDVTGAAADTDATAISANEVYVNIGYA